jgi:hypothetical protein
MDNFTDSTYTQDRHSVNISVVVHGTNGSAIRRDVAVSCVSDVLAAVASATEALQAQRPGQTCAYVVVQPLVVKRLADVQDTLLPGDIEIINICGRVTHSHTPAGVVRHACQPLMIRSRDSFGLRTGIFTVFGNFMTSESNKTTLFRGAKRSSDVLMIAGHIFEENSIDSIVMHMLVAKARLPHAVIADARQFEHALGDSSQWVVTAVCVSEDMSYMKPLHLRLNDGRSTCVLVHIYSSGVVFFFVTCPGTPLSVEEESRVAAQCGEVYTCLAAVS